MTLPRERFGKTKDGTEVWLYELRSRQGHLARVTEFGATLVQMHVPDRNGVSADVVLGFDGVEGYQSAANQYFGCTTGRVANRIAKGAFTLSGTTYQLAINNGPNHLHGGATRSLDKVVWEVERAARVSGGEEVVFHYRSPHLEEGYPGVVDLHVTYRLTDAGALEIEYRATTDRATPLNLTNHAYWNLAGAGAGDVLGHELQVRATRYTPTDAGSIPTGELAPVAGTALDFRQPTPIGARLAAVDATPAQGYDHNFALDRAPGTKPQLAAKLRDPASGRVLEILATQPGLQVYSGNFLRGDAGKGGKRYVRRGAVCLETQHFPDSVNQPAFPSVVLEPGAEYRHTTVHRFSIE
ncbi:MAG: galactose mutarotase [Planctomycetes bacterium]|nr:galactose mutarotase [Planctomycetota bacterium]